MVAPRAGWYGLAYESQAAALQQAGRLTRFGDVTQGVRMLAAGRAAFVLGDAAAVEHAAARAGVQVQPLPFWVAAPPCAKLMSRALTRPSCACAGAACSSKSGARTAATDDVLVSTAEDIALAACPFLWQIAVSKVFWSRQ